MKTVFGVVAVGLIVTAVLLAELVRSFVAASPYLLVFVLVFGALRARVRRSVPRRGVEVPARAPVPPRFVGPPSAGWVWVPVWLGPPRAHLPVLDAEVLDERREPT